MADATTAPDALYPLGILPDGATLPTIDDDALNSFARGPLDPSAGAAQFQKKIEEKAANLGVVRGVNMEDLSSAGWAVMYGPSVTANIKEKLEPLLELRSREAGARYRVIEGDDSCQKGDDATAWLKRKRSWATKGVANARVNPENGIPFYILIVAKPTEIPFEFQFGLDLNWGVGRLWFDDEDDFGRYAESVVAYESAKSLPNTREFVVFAPQNGKDEAMNLLCQSLANPMVAPDNPFGAAEKFRTRGFIGDTARVGTLDAILRGKAEGGSPAMLFTGSHGMCFLSGDERQAAGQGAIVCEDWRGVDSPPESAYYTGKDAKNANVFGMVHFLFNCYGCGWPRKDTYTQMVENHPVISPEPMLAALPQALLGHKNGGALAVIGHVDRAWSTSYCSDLGPQTDGFRDVMEGIMAGSRMGSATDTWNDRWSQLSAALLELTPKFTQGLVDRHTMKQAWIARDDARNYIVFGDPAVRLRPELLK
jgi:hypothetical protein